MPEPTSLPPPPAPRATIHRVYLRAQSLKLPAGARGLVASEPAHMDVRLDCTHERLEANVIEAHLAATLVATRGSEVVFEVHCQQAGIFELENATDAQVQSFVDVTAPGFLMPALRMHLADVLVRATLPPFYVPDMDWAELARTREAGNSADAAAPGGDHGDHSGASAPASAQVLPLPVRPRPPAD